uniref:Lipoprotein n=1 Tax=Mycoplasma feriruminatoris TaxID=1179777 RepID=A0A654IP78_9MOLU|nr:hypothetical protein MF5583_00664 [Mycoplasma feriruminatoris]
MKKILTTLTSFTLIATSTILVASCKINTSDKKIKQLTNKPDSKIKEEENKTPESKKDMSQGDQPQNEVEKGNLAHNNFGSNNNIFSSIEDEKDFIQEYYKYWDGINKKDSPHVFNPNNPNEIFILGFEKESGNKGGIKLKKIPKNVNKVPKILPRNITSLEGAFKDNENEKIDGIEFWNTSNIKNMYQTFYGAKKFNQDISGWDTRNVEDMNYMFFDAENFKRDLSKWSVPKAFYLNNFDKYSGIQDKEELRPKFKK